MRRSLLVAALVVGAASLQAQGTPATEAAIKRIYAMGMDSSQAPKLAQQLLDSLGPRLLGSPDMKAAQNWAVKTLGGWGVSAKVENFGTWRGWRRGYSHIDLIAPRTRSLEATMLGFSPGTGKKDKEGETLILPHFADSTEFVKWLPAVKGKFVMVSPLMQSCRPTEDILKNGTPATIAKDSAWRAENAREWGRNVRGTGLSLALGGGELAVRLEEAGAAAVITSRPTNSRGGLNIFETYTTKIPTIGVACEDYGLVYRLTDNNQHPKLRLNLDAELLGEQPIGNVIGRIPGTTKPDEYILLSAHFDSWDGGSGATDNGTGSVMMLEAMRILSTVLPKPQRTILIGLWAGEEEGLVGSGAFAEDHQNDVVKGLQAMFNQDNGTGRVMRVGAGGLPNGRVHLNGWLKQLVPEQAAMIMPDSTAGRPSMGGTDDASFACWGVPAFGLGGASWDYGVVTWHTTRDTFDKIAFDDLKHNATLVASLAYLASEDPTTITRERVDLNTLPAGGPPGAPARPGAAGGAPRTWPTCTPVPRVTKPRLK